MNTRSLCIEYKIIMYQRYIDTDTIKVKKKFKKK